MWYYDSVKISRDTFLLNLKSTYSTKVRAFRLFV
nr:MAG TPA: hypothetical protein [Caudoviricetes sp.]